MSVAGYVVKVVESGLVFVDAAADAVADQNAVSVCSPTAAEGNSKRSQTGASPEAFAAGGLRGAQKPPRATETISGRNMRLALFPLTDLGNAERFRERYLDKLLWCPALGWLAWDSKRWSSEG